MQQICQKCSSAFETSTSDREFHARVSPQYSGKRYLIPAPRLCVTCRKQRRYAWRNEFNYYKRQCEKCLKNIVSVYDPQSPYRVFCTDCYLNRDWDPLTFGREFEPSKSFFEQFHQLLLSVPRNTMVNDNGLGSENCEYTFNFVYGKNCYLTTTSWYAENCLYVSKSGRLRDVIDCDNVSESELIHECVSSNKLFNCQYLQDSQNCSDCYFGNDLRSCSDCFCCAGLTHKKYYMFNQSLSADEYRHRMKQIDFGSLVEVNRIKIEFEKFVNPLPRRASSLLNCENCSGDRLANCRNTIGFGIWNAEDVRYQDFGDTPKNSQDILVAGLCEWCYESQVPDHSSMTCFTNYCWSSQDVLYSDDCRYCKDLFGCVGLRQAQYCILNKQYSRAEYEKKVAEIVESMGQEYGEFFDPKFSFFGYNETIAQDYLPLSQEQARGIGFKWTNEEKNEVGLNPPAVQRPSNIKDVSIASLKAACSCSRCGRAYRVPQQELTLRKKLPAPFPDQCPRCRRLERTRLVNPCKLVYRSCDSCGQGVFSRHGKEAALVYCQECFLKTVE